MTLAGRFCWAITLFIAASAWPSEYPGPRLNEMVTAGNWPWCAMASDSLCVSKCVNALSGTGDGSAPAVLVPPEPPPPPEPDPPLAAWRDVPEVDVFALEEIPVD